MQPYATLDKVRQASDLWAWADRSCPVQIKDDLSATLFDSVENARLVGYKLHRREHRLTVSGRTLNQLRRLRGLLLDESFAA